MISKEIYEAFAIFAALCSISALIINFFLIPKNKRDASLVVVIIVVGLPFILLFNIQNLVMLRICVLITIVGSCYFSFRFGKIFNSGKLVKDDIELIEIERPNIYKWINKQISECKESKIEIDAFGIKLSSLYRVIRGGKSSDLPFNKNVEIRTLILAQGSFGVITRGRVEPTDKVVQDVELYNRTWKTVEDKYLNNKDHLISVRLFEFNPPFYFIRVNKKMMVGAYLAETGHHNLSIFLKHYNGDYFEQFTRYFDKIWDNNDLSGSFSSKSPPTP